MIVRNKRVIYLPDGSKKDLGNMLLTEFLDPESYGSMRLWNYASSKLGYMFQTDPNGTMEKIRILGYEHLMAYLMWNYVNVTIRYVGDTESFRRADWWQLPSETEEWGTGDCEDSSFLLSSGLERIPNISYYCIIGYFLDQGTYYGHAFVIFHNQELEKWLVLETTLDNEISFFVGIPWDPDRYVPAVAFTRKEFLSMIIKSHRDKLGLSDEWYNRHCRAIRDMIDYILTGMKLDVKWMHKSRRPVRLNADEVEVLPDRIKALELLGMKGLTRLLNEEYRKLGIRLP